MYDVCIVYCIWLKTHFLKECDKSLIQSYYTRGFLGKKQFSDVNFRHVLGRGSSVKRKFKVFTPKIFPKGGFYTWCLWRRGLPLFYAWMREWLFYTLPLCTPISMEAGKYNLLYDLIISRHKNEGSNICCYTVSYTHLTLPTIYSV